MNRILDNGCLLVLLVIVAIRPLVSESFDSSINSMTEAIGDVADPSSVRTLVFDMIILAMAGVCLVSRVVIARRPFRSTGLGWGTLFFVAASAVSCIYAGNKRLAFNASIDWLCHPIMAITLVQLLDTRRLRRLLLCVILATAFVQATQCFEQALYGFDETWAHYESIKQDYWASQGVALDSTRVESFERRLQARETTGFLSHSNITGSHLILCGFGAIALLICAVKSRRAGRAESRNYFMVIASIAATALTLSLTLAAATTKSLGALISGGVGLFAWLVMSRLSGWIDQSRRKAVLVIWGLGLVGILAVVGYGLYHDSLPGWSLTFRWQYWTASAEMIADHPLTGVGRENFGRHYLQYKSIESPEEVANPHNLFVQAASEFGLLGVAGILVMFAGASRVFVRSRCDTLDEPASDQAEECNFTAWAIAIGSAMILARISLLGTDEPAFIYYASVTTGLAWALGFLCTALAFRTTNRKGFDPQHTLSVGLTIGLGVTLMHDMINFALFVPAVGATFFAIYAYVVSASETETKTQMQSARGEAWTRWAYGIGWGAAMLVVFTFGLLPVMRSSAHLQSARSLAATSNATSSTRAETARQFEAAAHADPWDSTPLVARAQWLVGHPAGSNQSVISYREAAQRLSEAIERDPHHVKLRRMRAGVLDRIAGSTGAKSDLLDVVHAAEEALRLYPQNPREHAALAAYRLNAGVKLQDNRLIHKAIDGFEEALDLDDRRLAWEQIRRLLPREKNEIERQIALARSNLRAAP